MFGFALCAQFFGCHDQNNAQGFTKSAVRLVQISTYLPRKSCKFARLGSRVQTWLHRWHHRLIELFQRTIILKNTKLWSNYDGAFSCKNTMFLREESAHLVYDRLWTLLQQKVQEKWCHNVETIASRFFSCAKFVPFLSPMSWGYPLNWRTTLVRKQMRTRSPTIPRNSAFLLYGTGN